MHPLNNGLRGCSHTRTASTEHACKITSAQRIQALNNL
jgi:hypothetical protein